MVHEENRVVRRDVPARSDDGGAVWGSDAIAQMLRALNILRPAGKSGSQHFVKLRNGGIHEPNPQSRLHEGIP
jgi:hypothetical protein